MHTRPAAPHPLSVDVCPVVGRLSGRPPRRRATL